MDDIDSIATSTSRIKLDSDAYFGKGTRSSKVGSGSTSDKADRATNEQVLDPRTRMILFKMINRGVIFEMNGCVSTGKEANVYHASTESGEHRAIKIYKTSILVFKDRDRYVSGEFRFRQGYSRHNPRKMVKLWAEKETRNLKRIYQSGIPVPKPLHLHLHVLVMEFLGDEKGWPSPRLRDANIDPDEYPALYRQLIAYMRILYHKCRLVHADLSEYNILYHQKKLFIIDVSQSVEHDHPHSLEFLRMDIKNVNDYFRKQGVQPYSERFMFKFITNLDKSLEEAEIVEELRMTDPGTISEKDELDDAVFRSVYIPQNLEQVYDVERDTARIDRGEGDDLIYKDLLGGSAVRPEELDQVDEEKNQDSDLDSDSESDSESDSDQDEEDDYSVWKEKPEKTRKFIDREANKQRKKELKAEAKEKRQKKMKKNVKKKLVSQSKGRKS